MDIISKSKKETFDIGGRLASDLKSGEVFALFGDLGAGKTTFTKGIANALGIEKTIKSPTFNIIKVYPIKNNSTLENLIHIDAYRLGSSIDAESIGLMEIIDNPKNVVVIEWPENIWPLIKDRAKPIKFTFIDDNSRQISY